MTILINNPELSTKIFISLFIFVLIISLRKKKYTESLPPELTQELKGIAILAVIFSHVGYFISSDNSFLFPLSVLGGVGVNLFLFLSGFGLTASALKKELTVKQFYLKRLVKLLIPFWIILALLFGLDYFASHTTYSWIYVIHSFLGYFPTAHLIYDLNSPFWFLTPLIFYYLIFPFVFSKKYPIFSAIGTFLIFYLALQFKLPIADDVQKLYHLHDFAFPLGMACAGIFSKQYNFGFLPRIKEKFSEKTLKIAGNILHYLTLLIIVILFIHFGYYSGVGQGVLKEQGLSLLTVGLILAFFIIKRWEITAFSLFGLFSFEIYMMHWPIMAHHDFLFKYIPGWIAMILYLLIFLALSWIVQRILKPKTKKLVP